ncbi:hypothetical protein GQ55_7G292300 [Panicum hallii var. hallii]|uniref:Uncharacterized protein n=2 Tax=Panicum hallii TaxID=206008 RepID=A0A2T7D086_9POAL|nr:hypothetical protein GQ55_7G292300 [Panicum hallii var. hallii]PVH35881.1 hypothetical protein PAHAL_7G299900 [Panicum hallii]
MCQRAVWYQRARRLQPPAMRVAPEKYKASSKLRGDRDSFKRCRRLQSSNRRTGGFRPFFYAHDFAVPTYNRFLVSFGAGDPQPLPIPMPLVGSGTTAFYEPAPSMVGPVLYHTMVWSILC